jgi:hypothetical protein
MTGHAKGFLQSHPILQAPGSRKASLLWGVFFLMCLGLGYPTLNRYDPRKLLPDSASYRTLATAGPATVPEPFRFRVLESYLVRPLYRLALGHVGSWDPLWFGFLLVNSWFVASTAFLLFRVGGTQFGNHSTALVAATLYLLNFAISNAQLAGLVDASEGFFLMAVVVSLLVGRSWLLPVLGVFGALAKESFVPFSLTMAGAWWLLSKSAPPREPANRLGTGLAIAAMAIVELLTVSILQSSISARWVWPWSFAAGLNSLQPCHDLVGFAPGQRFLVHPQFGSCRSVWCGFDNFRGPGSGPRRLQPWSLCCSTHTIPSRGQKGAWAATSSTSPALCSACQRPAFSAIGHPGPTH